MGRRTMPPLGQSFPIGATRSTGAIGENMPTQGEPGEGQVEGPVPRKPRDLAQRVMAGCAQRGAPRHWATG